MIINFGRGNKHVMFVLILGVWNICFYRLSKMRWSLKKGRLQLALFWKKGKGRKKEVFFVKKNKSMQLASNVCSMFNCPVLIDPEWLSFFAKDRLIFRKHLFKGKGLYVTKGMSRFAKVYSTWFLLVLNNSI